MHWPCHPLCAAAFLVVLGLAEYCLSTRRRLIDMLGRGIATVSDYRCIDKHCNSHDSNSFAPASKSVNEGARERKSRQRSIRG
ncbi:hypothetical protein F5146DRAFT_233990 [Armillaria mellea]|nr:hypothetical protein F5146DRAFT_233990 [Armillaria mellea]